MPASPFDSAIYRDLLHDEEVGKLFTDIAEIRAMMRVEGALAKVQGELGLIPSESASAIHLAANTIQLDPASLSAGTAQAGIPVPELVTAYRTAMDSPKHSQYLHWGATSQDIMDTGLIVRLAEICTLVEVRITKLLQALARQADEHAVLPIAARTRSQIATPTSLGAVIATWGAPLLEHREALSQLKPRLLKVSLAGASGNATALGTRIVELRSALAKELGLADSVIAWHNNRSALSEFSSLLTRIGGCLAKIGEDHILASQTEVDELQIKEGGGSSTMPQKNNPVASETLVSLFRISSAAEGLIKEAVLHRQQRDGVAWSLEGHALPQICMATARALTLAFEVIDDLQPNLEQIDAHLTDGLGLSYAEAISFELASIMPRPEAQSAVKRLCTEALERNRSLSELVTQSYPGITWTEIMIPDKQLGDAPHQARTFAERVRELRLPNETK